MARPDLTLQNEIVNYFSHISSDQIIPSKIKSLLKELSTLDWARGQLFILEKNKEVILNSKNQIEEVKEFIAGKETEIKARYYIEEIKGT